MNSTHLHLKVSYHILNDALFAFQEFSNYYELLFQHYFINKVICLELTNAVKNQILFLLFVIFDFYPLLIVLLFLRLAFLFLYLFLSKYFKDLQFFNFAQILFYQMFSFAFSLFFSHSLLFL